jgi:predicted chitinase
MTLSGATVRAALASIGAVGKQIASMDELASGANGALRRAPGLTAPGAAAFLATCAQESAYFRTTTEYGTGQRYAPYIGRTFTQITWEQNYRDFGRWCHARGLVSDPETFVRNPRSLGDYRWAWLGPIQYWEENGIWRWANAGDFRAVSQAINGGNGRVGTNFTPHGWTERQKMYAAFLKAGNTLLPTDAPPPAPTYPTLREGDVSELVWRLAGFMNQNYPAYSRIDRGPGPTCRLGPQTRAALEEFQRRSGIPTAPPFAVGPKTWTALTKAGFR